MVVWVLKTSTPLNAGVCTRTYTRVHVPFIVSSARIILVSVVSHPAAGKQSQRDRGSLDSLYYIFSFGFTARTP